ncbi:MAG: HNH endonuclease [Bacteriovoracaceae bacterium]|nr:HNH endonuclease [Bacteriovoracaceae bacterium]
MEENTSPKSIQHQRYACQNTFSEKLEFIIFERDRYTCQSCFNAKDILDKTGFNLKAVHVKPIWEGGETSFENGQSLCSHCIKQTKHMSKVKSSEKLRHKSSILTLLKTFKFYVDFFKKG